MHAEAGRLFAAEAALRAEAEEMLARSGIGAILREAGYGAVGSYVMHTMTWRDLDFERVREEPDWGGPLGGRRSAGGHGVAVATGVHGPLPASVAQ